METECAGCRFLLGGARLGIEGGPAVSSWSDCDGATGPAEASTARWATAWVWCDQTAWEPAPPPPAERSALGQTRVERMPTAGRTPPPRTEVLVIIARARAYRSCPDLHTPRYLKILAWTNPGLARYQRAGGRVTSTT